jgi:hypothetical protein
LVGSMLLVALVFYVVYLICFVCLLRYFWIVSYRLPRRFSWMFIFWTYTDTFPSKIKKNILYKYSPLRNKVKQHCKKKQPVTVPGGTLSGKKLVCTYKLLIVIVLCYGKILTRYIISLQNQFVCGLVWFYRV